MILKDFSKRQGFVSKETVMSLQFPQFLCHLEERPSEEHIFPRLSLTIWYSTSCG